MSNEQAIIDKIDGLAVLLTGQIEGLDRRLTSEIGKVNAQMSGMDRRLTGQIDGLTIEVKGLNEREDLLFQKMVEIDERLDDLASNVRVDDLENRMMIEFDKQTTVLKRLDEERLSSFARMDRIEGRLNSAGIA